MKKYACRNCGYNGEEFIYEFIDYSYCTASNEEEPGYLDSAPLWVSDKASGEAEIGEPVGCPKCHTWGVNNFELTQD